jgi:hypothetical protein
MARIEFQGRPELSRDVGNIVAKFRRFQIVTSLIAIYLLQTNQKYWNMSVICTDGENLSVLIAV